MDETLAEVERFLFTDDSLVTTAPLYLPDAFEYFSEFMHLLSAFQSKPDHITAEEYFATFTKSAVTTDCLFILAEPLNKYQRKSYQKENRFLLPHPIVCTKREYQHSILGGIVAVTLVDEMGSSVSQEYLQTAVPGGKALVIHPLEFKTSKFLLKIAHNNGLNKFRLKFVVVYLTITMQVGVENILTDVFYVQSLQKKQPFTSP